MKRWVRIVLIVVAVCSFGIAFSYPLLYKKSQVSNDSDLSELADLRRELLAQEGQSEKTEENKQAEQPEFETGENISPVSDGVRGDDSSGDVNGTGEEPANGTGEEPASGTGEEPANGTVEEPANGTGEEPAKETGEEPENGAAAGEESEDGITQEPGSQAGEDPADGTGTEPDGAGSSDADLQWEDLLLDYVPGMTWKQTVIPEYESLDAPVLVSGSSGTARENSGEQEGPEDRSERQKGVPYTLKEKVTLDEDRILPELLPAYRRNKDMTGWLVIPDTVIDYPVVQTQDSDYYLTHDFYGNENVNGQIILDTKCDNYTPSYNLVISGHHMRNGSMFGSLQLYQDYDYWQNHKLVTFDSLMVHRSYVVMAAFFSADYDEYEEGFRYNLDIVYEVDARNWLAEIEKARLYDTDIDAHFGDEFITLTTCDRSRRQDGRFVLICRRIREGEDIT